MRPCASQSKRKWSREQHERMEEVMKNGKKDTGKKTGTLRPWLIDVAVDYLR